MNKIIIVALLTVILLSTSLTISHANADTGKKKIAPFVDPKKDPQSYVKRYQNEPTYKAWFDKNYGSKYKSIYESVGLPEPTKTTSLTNKELDDKKVADAKKAEKIKLAKERAIARKSANQVKIDSSPPTFILSWVVFVQDIPSYAHSSMTMKVVDDAIKSWKDVNPNLKLRKISPGESYDYQKEQQISIRWVTRITDGNQVVKVGTPAPHIMGLTKSSTNTDVLTGSITSIDHKILIDLADLDCNGTPIYWDNQTLTNTLEHEFGHALGIKEHSSDPHNLMFADTGISVIDTHGYVIPRKITDGYYVGQRESKNKDCFIDVTNAYDPYAK